jgi:hypothetical protein
MGSCEHLVEHGALRLRPADPVLFMDDFKSALFFQPAQVERLRFGILIEGGNSGIQNCSLHRIRTSVQR